MNTGTLYLGDTNISVPSRKSIDGNQTRFMTLYVGILLTLLSIEVIYGLSRTTLTVISLMTLIVTGILLHVSYLKHIRNLDLLRNYIGAVNQYTDKHDSQAGHCNDDLIELLKAATKPPEVIPASPVLTYGMNPDPLKDKLDTLAFVVAFGLIALILTTIMTPESEVSNILYVTGGFLTSVVLLWVYLLADSINFAWVIRTTSGLLTTALLVGSVYMGVSDIYLPVDWHIGLIFVWFIIQAILTVAHSRCLNK